MADMTRKEALNILQHKCAFDNRCPEHKIWNKALKIICEAYQTYENADLIERNKILTVECLGHNADHYDKIEELPRFNPERR